jgi:hypothetical protein
MPVGKVYFTDNAITRNITWNLMLQGQPFSSGSARPVPPAEAQAPTLTSDLPPTRVNSIWFLLPHFCTTGEAVVNVKPGQVESWIFLPEDLAAARDNKLDNNEWHTRKCGIRHRLGYARSGFNVITTKLYSVRHLLIVSQRTVVGCTGLFRFAASPCFPNSHGVQMYRPHGADQGKCQPDGMRLTAKPQALSPTW